MNRYIQKSNKKTLQIISKSNYITQFILKDYIIQENKKNNNFFIPNLNNNLLKNNTILKSIKTQKDITYFFIPNQQIQIQPIFNNEKPILNSTQYQIQKQKTIQIKLLENVFNKIYLTNDTTKLNNHSFINTHKIKSSYFADDKEINQLIEIVILQAKREENTKIRHYGCSSQRNFYDRKNISSSFSQNSSINSFKNWTQIQSIKNRQNNSQANSRYQSNESKNIKQYDVYIVHSIHSDQQMPPIKWETFVEKYSFRKIQSLSLSGRSNDKKQSNMKLIYQMIFSTNLPKYGSSFKFLGFLNSQGITKKFLQGYYDPIKGNMEKMKKIQSYLFQLSQIQDQNQKNKLLQMRNSPCYSQQLRRQKRIPAQYFMQYKKLKQKILKGYFSLNKSFIQKGQIIDFQMKIQNLVCRFLLQHNYNFEIANKYLEDFLQWDYNLRKSFTLKYFQKFLNMDILMILGQDRMGRPVLLFKTYNFIADNVPIIQDYINFIFYYVHIYCSSKAKGYIDDFIIIADAANNTSKNFKLEVNTKMIPQGLKYLPRAFFKMIVINSSNFPYYVYHLAKPVLPSYTGQVLRMFKQGTNQDALKQCLNYMDIDIIPSCIGGKNDRFKDKSQQISTRDE